MFRVKIHIKSYILVQNIIFILFVIFLYYKVVQLTFFSFALNFNDFVRIIHVYCIIPTEDFFLNTLHYHYVRNSENKDNGKYIMNRMYFI